MQQQKDNDSLLDNSLHPTSEERLWGLENWVIQLILACMKPPPFSKDGVNCFLKPLTALGGNLFHS